MDLKQPHDCVSTVWLWMECNGCFSLSLLRIILTWRGLRTLVVRPCCLRRWPPVGYHMAYWPQVKGYAKNILKTLLKRGPYKTGYLTQNQVTVVPSWGQVHEILGAETQAPRGGTVVSWAQRGQDWKSHRNPPPRGPTTSKRFKSGDVLASCHVCARLWVCRFLALRFDCFFFCFFFILCQHLWALQHLFASKFVLTLGFLWSSLSWVNMK